MDTLSKLVFIAADGMDLDTPGTDAHTWAEDQVELEQLRPGKYLLRQPSREWDETPIDLKTHRVDQALTRMGYDKLDLHETIYLKYREILPMIFQEDDLEIEFSKMYRTNIYHLRKGYQIDIMIDGIVVGEIVKKEITMENRRNAKLFERCFGYLARGIWNGPIEGYDWRIEVRNTQYDKMVEETFKRSRWDDHPSKLWELHCNVGENPSLWLEKARKGPYQEPTARKALSRIKRLVTETLKERYLGGLR